MRNVGVLPPYSVDTPFSFALKSHFCHTYNTVVADAFVLVHPIIAMATYKESQRLARQLHTQYLSFIIGAHCYVDLNVNSVIGAFDIALEVLCSNNYTDI